MATLFDIDDFRRVNHRTDVLILLSHFRETQQAIQVGNDIGIDLNLRNKLLHTENQVVEEFGLEGEDLIFSAQNLLFVLLQLLGDIAFSLGQCLLANPLWRNQFLIGVANLEVIAKHIIISYL